MRWSTLPESVRKLFRIAMDKEWSKWEQFKATTPVNDKMLSDLPPGQKVIGTRWVLTYKSQGEAKARLVVQGCQEYSAHIRGDAPTASRGAMMLVFLAGSQAGWTLGQFDAECAYLQSEGLGRSLILRMPDPAPPGKVPGEVVAATGAIYGTKDAGRK